MTRTLQIEGEVLTTKHPQHSKLFSTPYFINTREQEIKMTNNNAEYKKKYEIKILSFKMERESIIKRICHLERKALLNN